LKTYLSILQYTTSLKKYIAPYFILSLLASIFGVLNFALLSPLLKVLFNQVESGEAEKRVTQLPDFSLSKEFFSDTFNYYLYNMLDVYGRMGALQFACAIIVVSVFFQTYSVTFLKESLKLLNPKRLRV
jgi:subfamily B ATP-binding cassette protein MsbA